MYIIIKINKKGIGLNDSFVSVLIVILLAILVIVGIIIFQSLGTSFNTESSSSSQTILSESTSTLSHIGDGNTSSEVKANNDTWINCTTDNFVETERFDIISFWYKNNTIDWIFVVNSSGTLYVNGVIGTPDIFPVYDNGIKMFLCKTGAASFFNGSIDDFRGYSSSIDAELVNLTYLNGRM